MKLRLFGNSIRVRLSRSEVDHLANDKAIISITHFSPDQFFEYHVRLADVSALSRAMRSSRKWNDSDDQRAARPRCGMGAKYRRGHLCRAAHRHRGTALDRRRKGFRVPPFRRPRRKSRRFSQPARAMNQQKPRKPPAAIAFPHPALYTHPSMHPRKTVKLTSWPDPLVQERLEDMGFFFDQPARSWIRFCEETEVQPLNDWLKRHHLSHEVQTAKGRGETKKHPRLSDELVLKNGGSPTRCALAPPKASPAGNGSKATTPIASSTPTPPASSFAAPACNHACNPTRASTPPPKNNSKKQRPSPRATRATLTPSGNRINSQRIKTHFRPRRLDRKHNFN